MVNKPIKTQTVGKDFAKTSGVLLDQTADTALVFFPQIHPGGVRGDLIRFKKVRNEEWERIPEEDFRKIQLFEGSHVELGTDAIKILSEAVETRKAIITKGIVPGRHEYLVAEKEEVIVVSDQNKKNVIEQLLTRGYSEEFWQLLSISDPGLADNLSAGHLLNKRKQVVEELRNRLRKKYSETMGEDSWQYWIYQHNWLFGVNYQKAISKQKISILGIMPDFLFPTMDDFVDLLEIKLPEAEVIEADPNHPGSWRWSREANSAIGQVVTYLGEIEKSRYQIQEAIAKKYDRTVSLLKPRGFILIGQSAGWAVEKLEALRKLNHSLHAIEVITYTELLNRGESFLSTPAIRA
ncbi:MAG: DUF4263 domain-containing protein [Bacteroidetes bacterium]|nr:DUF4263 domain-containing protein [Bacteroidota bacterium]